MSITTKYKPLVFTFKFLKTGFALRQYVGWKGLRSCCVLLPALVLFACSNVKKTSSAANPASKSETKLIYPTQPIATPANLSFVTDNEDLFTPAEVNKLDSLLRNFEKSNLVSIQLATIKKPEITVDNFDAANLILLKDWGTIHNGVDRCMAISISKNLRKMRIDCGATVLRNLSSEEIATIIESVFKPSYKKEEYYQGTVAGINALMDTIRKNIKF